MGHPQLSFAGTRSLVSLWSYLTAQSGNSFYVVWKDEEGQGLDAEGPKDKLHSPGHESLELGP